MELEHELTGGSLQIIMNGGDVVNPVMQILGNKKLVATNSTSERYRLLLSDGKNSISYGMISKQTISGYNGVPKDFSIVKLKRYITNVITSADKINTRIVLIMDMDMVVSGEHVGYKIGNPIPLTSESNFNSQVIDTHQVLTVNSNLSNTQIISPITSLNPFHTNWVIKARVTFKSTVRNWSNANGDGKLFTMDLLDHSGEIRCSAFRELVDRFFDFFEEDKVYYLSKCTLKHANKDYCNLNHFYEMTLVEESQVEECKDDSGVPQIKYNFVSFDRIPRQEAGTFVDIIGVCKEVRQPQTVTFSDREAIKRDIVLIDQSKIPIFVTLWGSHANNFHHSNDAVVVIRTGKVNEFSGRKYITTWTRSQVKINPKIPETLQMNNWYRTEGHLVDVSNIDERMLAGNMNTTWMTFRQVQELDHILDRAVFFQTMATVTLIKGDRPVYKACPTPKCRKKVIDMENGMYRCEKCNREYPNFLYILFFSMNLKDSSGNQWVSIFGSEAEKVLGKSGEEVGAALENNSDDIKEFFDDVTFRQFVFKCKATLEAYNDEERLKAVVVRADLVNYEEYNNHLLDKIQQFI